MAEIEVNEYVRTKDGIIGIFDRYSSRKENSLYKSPFNCFIKIKNRKTPLQCCEEYIVKHSKQLIDLIEVTDIIKYRMNNISTTLETKGYIEGIVDISDKEMLQRIKNDKNYDATNGKNTKSKTNKSNDESNEQSTIKCSVLFFLYKNVSVNSL